MLSRTARLAAIALLAQGVALLAKPQQARAMGAKRFDCGDPTGWCCNLESTCKETGVFCCYYKNGEQQTATCGCEKATLEEN
jgi:hypothetical protein